MSVTTWITGTLLPFWLLVEVLFYAFFRWRLHRLQRKTPPVHLPAGTRERIFNHIFRYLTPSTTRSFLQGWHFGAAFESIRVENVYDWIAWALFSSRPEDLTSHERAVMKDLVCKLEAEKIGHAFPPGRNPDIVCPRITLDSVKAMHRPLVLYCCMRVMWCLSGILLYRNGFRRHRSGQLSYWYRPQDPLAIERQPPESGGGGRPGDKTCPMSPVSASVASDPHPLVFIHGIGIGLIAYHWFLAGCWSSRATFVVELPHISMQLISVELSIEQTVEAIHFMLRTHKVEKACIMGHSFGTIPVAWMVKHRPEVISSCILLDPVCFLLFLPDWVLHYFARLELNISHTLSRHFWWHRNLLLPEELPESTTVLLSGRDEITPAKEVFTYLQNHNASKGVKGLPINILWYETFRHAQFLIGRGAQRSVYNALHKTHALPLALRSLHLPSLPSFPPLPLSAAAASPAPHEE